MAHKVWTDLKLLEGHIKLKLMWRWEVKENPTSCVSHANPLNTKLLKALEHQEGRRRKEISYRIHFATACCKHVDSRPQCQNTARKQRKRWENSSTSLTSTGWQVHPSCKHVQQLQVHEQPPIPATIISFLLTSTTHTSTKNENISLKLI